MSYQAQSELEGNVTFQGRVNSVNVQQANTYKDDARPSFVATATAILRDEPSGPGAALLRLAAAGPGIAEKVETDDGIDQSLVTDDDLLALTQANWQTVAALYFAEDGTPI